MFCSAEKPFGRNQHQKQPTDNRWRANLSEDLRPEARSQNAKTNPVRTRPTMKNQISKPVRLFTLALFHSNMNRTPANQAAKDEIPKVIISVGDASGFRQHANCVFIQHAGASLDSDRIQQRSREKKAASRGHESKSGCRAAGTCILYAMNDVTLCRLA